MSRSLLKKTLQLYEQEEINAKDVKPKKTTVDPSKPKKARKSIVERKREAKKNKMKLKTSVQDVKIKCILDDVRKEKNMDNTEKNLMILQGLSGSQMDVLKKKGIDKIVTHTRGRLAKNSVIEKPKIAAKSTFTDADFEEFERTYFLK